MNAEVPNLRQRSGSNAGSFAGSFTGSFLSSNQNDNTKHNGSSVDVSTPQSPTSATTPSLRKTASFTGSITSAGSQPQPPLIMVDSEGYSIPPPDRTAWPSIEQNNSESLLDTDDVNSDGGSLFSSQRIRVDIKNESLNEEDSVQSKVALNRVSTLLKEVCDESERM
jgi:hypothetical protein